ncbi:TRAP transporter small permease [Ruicaihuangia caeni]|uniref:TRAP transporter small permease n=1 Tax=Ruicaihuangia caeni TaxID=3042517 RepID=A0AAW6T507_9MICO|nr:TRAP transporter small permease [Klugiella sp. YN-L-19]MDI2097453.1 TRAP transporter small permease [Klugiella sp. YN-L-19]
MVVLALWERVIKPMTRGLAVISALLCGGLALLVTSEVVLRGFTGESIRGIFEIAELGLVMTVFLGFANAEVDLTHVRVTLLTDRLSPAAASRVRGVALILGAVFCAWMGWELIERAIESFNVGEFRTGLLNFPMWPSRSFVAAGTAFLSIVLLVKGLVLMTGRAPASATTSAEGGVAHVA